MNLTLVQLVSPNPKIMTRRKNLSKSNQFSLNYHPVPGVVIAKCMNKENGGNNLKDALSGMVGEQVEELLKKGENKGLLDDLNKATLRVELAKKELAEIEKLEIENQHKKIYIAQLEKRASEIEECQREISEAKSMVEQAERALSPDEEGTFIKGESEGINEIDKDEERLESVKASLISALVGTIAGLPFAFTQVTSTSQLILPVAITFISCALFGVTFRYTIRRDLGNVQLKNGTSAAFGIVKGLAMMGGGPPLELDGGSLLSHGFDGAVYVAESVFIFVFAAVSLDFCFKMGILSPYPIKKDEIKPSL